jgi:co-chaperonin GroES (HSP10)
MVWVEHAAGIARPQCSRWRRAALIVCDRLAIVGKPLLRAASVGLGRSVGRVHSAVTFTRILGDRLLISPLPEKEFSDGGIVLPRGQVGDVKQLWRVEQLGEGNACKDFSLGQTVITPLHFSHFTLEDGTGRKIVDCDQIVGVFEEPEPDL